MGQPAKLTAATVHLGVPTPIDFVPMLSRDSEGVFSRGFFFWKGTCPKLVFLFLVLLSTTNEILNATGEITKNDFSIDLERHSCTEKASGIVPESRQRLFFFWFFRFLRLLVSQYYHTDSNTIIKSSKYYHKNQNLQIPIPSVSPDSTRIVVMYINFILF